MSVYNCVTTIDAAVRSIVNQVFPDWELLLIDVFAIRGFALAQLFPRVHRRELTKLTNCVTAIRNATSEKAYFKRCKTYETF